MKTINRALLASAILLLSLTQAQADTVHLKNKKVIEGIVDTKNSDERNVIIRTSVGTLTIPRTNVERIEVQEGISFSEESGDLAFQDANWDRALQLYQKALKDDPNNDRLKTKLEKVHANIEARDQETYGTSFGEIRSLIAQKQYDKAIDEAGRLYDRIQEDTAKDRCKELMADAHIGIAGDYLDKVKIPEAEQHYLMAKQIYPNKPLAALKLADMKALSNQPEKFNLYKEGIQIATDHPGSLGPDHDNLLMEYRFTLGKLYYNDKRYSEAADLFVSIIRDDKTLRNAKADEYAVNSLSKMLQADIPQEEIDHIIDSLSSIIASRPQDSRAYLLLGHIYFDRKDYAKAKEALVKSVANKSDNAGVANQEALYYLGISLRKLGEIEPAADALLSLVNQHTGNYDVYCELGEIRIEQANYEEALKLFDEAMTLDKDKYRGYLGKGKALQKLNPPKFDESRQNLATVLRLDPGNLDAQFAIARSFFDQQKWEDATRELDLTIELIKNPPEEQKKRAKDQVGRVDRDKKIQAESYTMKGAANMNMKKTNVARENYEKALELDPKYASAMNGIGKTYEADGLHDDAEKYFLKAIENDPNNPDYQVSLGLNWHKYRKNYAKAKIYYDRYFELGGKDPNVRLWLKEVGGGTE